MTTHREITRLQITPELAKLAQAYRNPYAWPGGYEIATYISGDRICWTCLKDHYPDAVRDVIHFGATVERAVNWEGPSELCCECGCQCPSEYGDPEAGEGL